ncbi:MAG: hypothetical protein VXU42_02895, partial [Verrucomicrobiota bacterium]|nr:hypothetical protein [Verrucomicrobiota bacterium]
GWRSGVPCSLKLRTFKLVCSVANLLKIHHSQPYIYPCQVLIRTCARDTITEPGMNMPREDLETGTILD